MPIEFRRDGKQLVWVRNPFTGTVTYFTHIHKKQSGFVQQAQNALLHPPAVGADVFRDHLRDELEAARRSCPFCPGNEALAPEEILRVPAREVFPDRQTDEWLIRAVLNLIPRIPECCTGGRNESYVVIEDARHFADDAQGHEDLLYTGLLPLAQFQTLLAIDIEVARRSYANPAVQQVLIRKNQGKESGASQPHVHNQVIGSDRAFPPIACERAVTGQHKRIWEEILAFSQDHGFLLAEREGCYSYVSCFGTFPRSYEVVCLDAWTRCIDVPERRWRVFGELLFDVLQILGPMPLDFEIHDGPGVPLHAHVNARHYTYSNIGGTLNLPAHVGAMAPAA